MNENYNNVEKTIDTEKKYVLNSSAGIYISFIGRGRIDSTVIAYDEKITIQMFPVKKNKIPVIYFDDITTVMMNYKLPGYYIFWIILAIISCVASPLFVLCVPLLIWSGSNWKITICLRSGNNAVLYSKSKQNASQFVQDLKAVLGNS